ncbi:MAG: hypothetical protein ACOYXC_17325 [Candidatus Rifleibacteriota bacterium]
MIGRHLLLLILLCHLALPLRAQDESIIAKEYDKAFYAAKYTVALPLIKTLLAMDPENLAYQREYIKMLALLDEKEQFIVEFDKLRKIESDGHFDNIQQVISFQLLPEDYLQLIQSEAEKNNDTQILQRFFSQKAAALPDLKGAFNSLQNFLKKPQATQD